MLQAEVKGKRRTSLGKKGLTCALSAGQSEDSDICCELATAEEETIESERCRISVQFSIPVCSGIKRWDDFDSL